MIVITEGHRWCALSLAYLLLVFHFLSGLYPPRFEGDVKDCVWVVTVTLGCSPLSQTRITIVPKESEYPGVPGRKEAIGAADEACPIFSLSNLLPR